MKKHLLYLAAFVAAFCMHTTGFAQVNGGKKILIVATNSDTDLKYGTTGWGCYFPEIVDFYSRISNYGFTLNDIDIVSPQGGSIPLFEDDFQLPISPADEQAIREKVQHTLKPSDINAGDYNVIYYAGGISCLVDFPQASEIGTIASSIYESGGIVAAVCDGVSGLIPLTLSSGKPLVEGIKLTTNYYLPEHGIDVAIELNNKGALVDQSKGLIVDRRVITGQNVRPVQVASAMLKELNILFPTSVATKAQDKAAPVVYPNPAAAMLFISAPAGNTGAVRYSIRHITGQNALQGVLQAGKAIDISGLPTGQYIVETQTSNGEVFRSAIAVQSR